MPAMECLESGGDFIEEAAPSTSTKGTCRRVAFPGDYTEDPRGRQPESFDGVETRAKKAEWNECNVLAEVRFRNGRVIAALAR